MDLPEGEFRVSSLPGSARLTVEHRRAGQQRDDLCGPYWVSILLRVDGFDVDEEDAAGIAGTLLPGGAPEGSVPPGVAPRHEYRRELPRAPERTAAGTAVPGLVEAVSRSSMGTRVLVPLRTGWDAGRVEQVLALCRSEPSWGAVPLANVRTGMLWGSRLPLSDAIAWLEGEDVEPPPADWDVGHFLAIAGTWDGRARSLVIVRDSYPTFGWDGYHLQPPEVLAAALRRGDGVEGGVALYVPADAQADVERQAKDAGFEITAWDNGTPWKA